MIEQGDLERKQLDWIKRVRELSNAVTNERLHQLGKWGYQRHSEVKWLAILAEEFGESAKATCDSVFGLQGTAAAVERSKLRAELIQVAAVATAFAQAIDTGEA